MNTQKFDFNGFKDAGDDFLLNLSEKLLQAGIPVGDLKCDHLCFRVSTVEEYNFYKAALVDHATLLTEAMVNGRLISTLRLFSAFQVGSHEVSLLELPAPKAGTPYSTGFEHAEFVIAECFLAFRSKYPHLNFVEAGNQTLNPELCLKLGQRAQAKFHHLSLDRVIELEEAQIKDIIFDFDGTLIKSREHIYEINRIVFSNILGREVSLQESIDNFHSEFSKLFDAFSVRCPDKQSQAIASWGSVSSRFSCDLFDGVLETLRALKNHGFRLHLWTARDEFSARKILRQHDIESLFTTLSFATDVNSKPHASSLCFDWKVAGRNQVIVVGDSPSDVIGAKNISAISGAALWDTHSNRSSLVATGAELFFERVADFRNWMFNSVKDCP